MTGVVANDPIPELLGVLLHSIPDITDPVVYSSRLNAKFQTLVRNTNELSKLITYLSDRNRCRCITNKSLIRRSHIDRSDIALF